jgi:hypothetical protein
MIHEPRIDTTSFLFDKFVRHVALQFKRFFRRFASFSFMEALPFVGASSFISSRYRLSPACAFDWGGLFSYFVVPHLLLKNRNVSNIDPTCLRRKPGLSTLHFNYIVINRIVCSPCANDNSTSTAHQQHQCNSHFCYIC